MSNIGLKLALERLGITHVVSGIGDRCVMEEMVTTGAVIGGENSGHMIFRDRHTTGDGILAGLKIIDIMQTRSVHFRNWPALWIYFHRNYWPLKSIANRNWKRCRRSSI